MKVTYLPQGDISKIVAHFRAAPDGVFREAFLEAFREEREELGCCRGLFDEPGSCGDTSRGCGGVGEDEVTGVRGCGEVVEVEGCGEVVEGCGEVVEGEDFGGCNCIAATHTKNSVRTRIALCAVGLNGWTCSTNWSCKRLADRA